METRTIISEVNTAHLHMIKENFDHECPLPEGGYVLYSFISNIEAIEAIILIVKKEKLIKTRAFLFTGEILQLENFLAKHGIEISLA
jgi:hypothetical protein